MGNAFKVKGIDVVYYHVPDMPAAERWYKDVLGLPVGQAFPGWSELLLEGDVRFALDAPEGEPSEMEAAPNAVVSFRVDDLDVALAHMRAQGVEVYGEIMDFGPTRVATIRDPFGNFIQLSQPTGA
jgi:catechol 2,3-dioxygenase-like lactoylglutathione lyase family enzyme